ncbi:hypothetical protein ABZ135_18400 [Streptomyces sp. NPDC006339]|uniref:phage tail protein n=1 Tax=Streptomyces sp. NPDC006339 TaxID=3156755 RepID=UPI0033B27153
MAEEVGVAYVRLLPSLRGFAQAAREQLDTELSAPAQEAGEEAGEAIAEGIADGAEEAKGSLRGLATAFAGLTAGLPVVAAGTAALAGLAAGAASAGAAVKAFQVAVAPQMEAIAEATTAAEKAEKAHAQAALKSAQAQRLAAKGGEEYQAALREAATATKAASLADAAYEQQLAALPKPTQDYARALQGLKDDHQAWSDSMAATTMPVMTRGINLLRGLLPSLTPFVKAAAGAFGQFLGTVEAGTKSAKFQQWVDSTAKAAGPALLNLLTTIKNFAVGFASLVGAFSGESGRMTGGLLSMSAAFSSWAQSLKGSEGFAQFLDLAREGGGAVMNLAAAAGNLLVALGPLLGATATLANLLATVVNAIPTPVLTALAAVLVGVKAGMLGYAAGAKVVTLWNKIMASSTWVAISGWVRMNLVALRAYAQVAAAAVSSAASTAAAWMGAALRSMATFAAQVLRTAAVAVAQFVLMAARAVVWAAVMAAQWLIAMGPIGWIIAAVIGLAALIIANWDKIKQWSAAAWDWIWAKIKAVGDMIVNFFLNWTLPGLLIKHWDGIKAKAMQAWDALVAWIRGIPGKIYSLFLNWTLPGLIIKHWQSIKDGTVRKATEMLAWVRGLPGRITGALGSVGSLLYTKGQDIVRGLLNGVKSMGGWLRSSLMGFARSMVPGPIAKALGIASPSKVMADEVGRWIPPGIAMGIESNLSDVTVATRAAVTAGIPTAAASGPARPAAAAGTTVVIDGSGMPPALLEWLRHSIRIEGGGNVQAALGQN